MLRCLRCRRNRHTLAFYAVLLTFSGAIILRWRQNASPSWNDVRNAQGASHHVENTGVSREDDVMAFRRRRFELYRATERSREGPCEKGRRVPLEGVNKTLGDGAFAADGFNYVASDLCALDRSIVDTRMEECKTLTYPEDLPRASVVIIYYNEYYSAILRTVHSVVNRSPPEYLEEVILLDDASNKTDLGAKLHNYVNRTWPDGVVRIVRSPVRGGLIKARVAGGRAARGDVIVFLDAHCEANTGWLEPLLARIKEKRSAVLVPSIDSISASSLEYSPYVSRDSSIGGFTWSLHFTWTGVPAAERQRRKAPTDPLRTPTMPGGLLALDRRYFIEMGEYDDQMEIWGGENLEISFRVWMCGGSVEFIPCSHVGHIFRATHPYGFPSKTRDYHGINSKRMAEVWMDDYKRLFYYHRTNLPEVDVGDLTERKQLRERLQCKDFKWYLDNVVFDKFVIDENVYGWGQFRNPVTNMCFDTYGRSEKEVFPVKLYPCQPSGLSFNEVFALSLDNQIRRDEDTCAVSSGADGAEVTMKHCSMTTDSYWHFTKSTGQLVHGASGKCVDAADLKQPRLQPCRQTPHQVWAIEFMLLDPPATDVNNIGHPHRGGHTARVALGGA